MALNWLITQRNTFPIPGAKNEHQARQNAGAFGWEMTSEEAEKLESGNARLALEARKIMQRPSPPFELTFMTSGL